MLHPYVNTLTSIASQEFHDSTIWDERSVDRQDRSFIVARELEAILFGTFDWTISIF